MIVSWKHKGLKKFYDTGSKAGINPKFAPRLTVLLTTLDAATSPEMMDGPGSNLHLLKGDLVGHWAVSVSGNWRLTFRFEGENAEVVNLQDYH